MPRPKSIPPIEAFRDSVDDAAALIDYARAFKNQRDRAMRKELRNRVGEALRLSSKARNSLDCLQSEELFVVFLNAESLGRDRFTDRRPLLRQAIVAASAALESYIADKAIQRLGRAFKANPQPKRIRDIPLTVGHWIDIEDQYKRRVWGVRVIVEEVIRKQASTSPSRIGEVLSTVGIDKWSSKVDELRKVGKGTTVKQLDALTKRRNLIAHTADRKGQGRANIDIKEAQTFVDQVRDIAQAMEKLFNRS